MYSEDDKQEVYGDWGWIDKKTLNESLSKAAFSLKPGEVMGVVNFSGGWFPSAPLTTPYYANAGRGAADKVPQLWFYADNDRLYGEAMIRGWNQAFVAAGGRAGRDCTGGGVKGGGTKGAGSAGLIDGDIACGSGGGAAGGGAGRALARSFGAGAETLAMSR